MKVVVIEEWGGVRKLRDIELEIIKLVRAHNEGNEAQTARDLGIGRSTIRQKMKRVKMKRVKMKRVKMKRVKMKRVKE